MEKFKLDCCFCAFECYKQEQPGLYCNYFNEKIAAQEFQGGKTHKAFRHNNTCEGFTLFKYMEESFKKNNPKKEWDGPTSEIELEQ